MAKSKCSKLKCLALAKMTKREFEKWLKSIPKETETEAKKTIEKYTKKVQAASKRMAPVDTGYLQRSIEMQIVNGGWTGFVFVGALYGQYVEFGTSTHFAQPFFFPAYDMFVSKYVKDMEKILEKVGG